MTIACALPPLDMRYARVVAVDRIGFDATAFDAGEPSSAAVVAPVSGIVRRGTYAGMTHYRNPLMIDASEAAGRPLFVVLSGMEFGSRAPEGSRVRPGDVVGRTEAPGRIAFLRQHDHTSGVDPRHAYLHVEVWTRLPIPFNSRLTVSGVRSEPVADFILDPRSFWPSIGLDFTGPARSQLLAVRRGGLADCTGRA